MSNRARSVLAKLVVPLWPVTIVGVAVGAIVGTLAVPSADTYSATSVISVEVPISANQLMTGTQPFADSQPDYLGGELDYLNSDGFRSAVATYLGQSSIPDVSATRSGKSDQFAVTATAGSVDAARQTADKAVAAYLDHVRQDNKSRYTSAVAAIDAVIPRVQDAMATAGIVAPTPELIELYTQRAALEVQLERAPGVVVVQPTTDVGAAAAPPYGPVGGAVLGGVLAFGAALLWRSRSGIITSPAAIGEKAAPCPVVPLGKASVEASVARSVYAVLPAPRKGRIVVVGVSESSDTRTVADYLSFAASEHGPSTDVDLTADATASSISGDVGDTAVINAGVWASSPAVTDAVDHADHVVIVARLGYDTRNSVAKLCQAISQRPAPYLVVCVKSGLLKS